MFSAVVLWAWHGTHRLWALAWSNIAPPWLGQDVVDLFGGPTAAAAVRFAAQVLVPERDVASGESTAGLVSAVLLPRFALVFAASTGGRECGASDGRAARWSRGRHGFTRLPDNRMCPDASHIGYVDRSGAFVDVTGTESFGVTPEGNVPPFPGTGARSG